jgi:hypothetical protein
LNGSCPSCDGSSAETLSSVSRQSFDACAVNRRGCANTRANRNSTTVGDHGHHRQTAPYVGQPFVETIAQEMGIAFIDRDACSVSSELIGSTVERSSPDRCYGSRRGEEGQVVAIFLRPPARSASLLSAEFLEPGRDFIGKIRVTSPDTAVRCAKNVKLRRVAYQPSMRVSPENGFDVPNQ